jgi:hypothetical protein
MNKSRGATDVPGAACPQKKRPRIGKDAGSLDAELERRSSQGERRPDDREGTSGAVGPGRGCGLRESGHSQATSGHAAAWAFLASSMAVLHAVSSAPLSAMDLKPSLAFCTFSFAAA